MKKNIIFLSLFFSFGLTVSLAFGAVIYPTSTPIGEVPSGTFNSYFSNMFSRPGATDASLYSYAVGCPAGKVIRGFSSTGILLCLDGNTYWKSNDGGVNTFFTGAGNVGIGTTNPQGRLHIGGGTYAGAPSGTLEKKQITIDPPSHAGGPWNIFTRDDPSNAYFDTRYNNINVFTIRHDGNIGIGTMSPSAKLEVSGDSKLGDVYGGVYGGTRAIWKFDTTNPTYGVFYTESTPDRLSIAPNGGGTTSPSMTVNGDNVGIGTISPGERLDVAGKIRVGRGGIVGSYGNTTNHTSTQNIWSIGSSWNIDSAPATGFGNIYGIAYSYEGYGGISGWGHQISFHDNGNRNAAISLSNGSAYFGGNVGIGTSAPSQKLEVTGEVRSSGGANGFASVDRTDGANKMIMYLNNGALNFDDYGAGTRMTIQRTTGNIGMGTVSPSYKLHVAGDIYANGGWLRTSGANGWYSESYGGGWFMQDTTWIRGYNGKSLWMSSGLIGGDGGLTIGYGGATPPSAGAIIAGNVGIATSSPGTALDVNGNIRASGSPVPANWYNIQGGSVGVSTVYGYTRVCSQNSSGDCGGNGGVVMGAENTNAAISLGSNGNIYASNYYYRSDIRLKKDITILSGSLDKIKKLHGYSFNWKKDNSSQIGLIAQEVEEVFPQVVNEGVSANGEEGNYKAVQYGNLVAPLIESTKELASLHDAQEREIDILKRENAELKARLDKLESLLK